MTDPVTVTVICGCGHGTRIRNTPEDILAALQYEACAQCLDDDNPQPHDCQLVRLEMGRR